MAKALLHRRTWLDARLGDAEYAWVYRIRQTTGGGRTGRSSTLHRASCPALLTAQGHFYPVAANEVAAKAALIRVCQRCQPVEVP